MSFSSILAEEHEGGVLLVTVNRPGKLNALNRVVIDELEECFRGARDNSDVRAVVLTGAGTRAFVAGADIGEFAGLSAEAAEQLARRGQKVFLQIERLRKPVIAAVNGFALGGGCELALACHIRVAADNASFGQPEVNLGIIPGYGGTQRLPRLVGRGRAAEMLMSGDRISAQRAYEVGLVNAVVPADDLIENALALASTLASKAPLAVTAILESLHYCEGPLADGLAQEAMLFGSVLGTEDAREGVAAFLEKRKAEFKGR